MPDSISYSRKRWILFAVLALIYILVYFYRVSLAVVAGDISRELHLTPQQLGSLSGILFYVYALAQLPLGPLIDRLGSRLVISASGVLTAIGGILFSQAGNLATAMTARILIGIGTASVLMATLHRLQPLVQQTGVRAGLGFDGGGRQSGQPLCHGPPGAGRSGHRLAQLVSGHRHLPDPRDRAGLRMVRDRPNVSAALGRCRPDLPPPRSPP